LTGRTMIMQVNFLGSGWSKCADILINYWYHFISETNEF
jgi:hypothetical protein